VGLVEIPSLGRRKNLSLEMLRAGWATTYEQAGAEYGDIDGKGKGGKDEFLRVEARAKAARRGMWATGVTLETPAEYKKRHTKAEAEGAAMDGKTIAAIKKARKPRSWLKRLLKQSE